jgi:PAS domain S-box-containing protein
MTKQVIICIDDEIMVLDALKVELKDAIAQGIAANTLADDCLIEMCQGGEEALELTEQLLEDGYEILLVISDHIMPDMKGDELLKQIHLRSPKTLKIMLTGQANLEAVGNAIKYADLYRYIAKPWQPDDLKLTVKEALNSYLKEKQLTEQTEQLQQMNRSLQELNSEQATLIEALKKAEEKYRSIFENAFEGIFQTTPDGRFLSANPALAHNLGYDSPEELMATLTDMRTQLYVDPHRRDEFVALMKQSDRVAGFEAEGYCKDGSTIWVSINARTVRNAEGKILYYQGFILHITERKQAEKLLADYNQILERQVAERTLELQQEILERKRVEVALQESEARFRQLAEATFEAIAITEKKIILDTNQTFARMFSYEPSEVMGMHAFDFVSPEDRELVEEKLRSRDEDPYECLCVKKDGTTFPAEVRARFVSWGDRIVKITAIRDITARKQLEEASVLEERNRLAREIHDTLAQAFTGILIQLEAASRVSSALPEQAQLCFIQIYDLAQSGLNEARRSVKALRPQLLEKGNLHSAIARLVATMNSSGTVSIISQMVGTPYPLPADAENNLLRIGQEAANNAIKHSLASEIKIELAYEQTQCILRIKDNGRGFTVDGLSANKGFGLVSMRERAKNIGANLLVQSHPGQGTEIVVALG